MEEMVCGLGALAFLICSIIYIAVSYNAHNKTAIFMNRYIHARKLKKIESNGNDATGNPIIDFEDFEKYYWINPKSWKISLNMRFYDGFLFPIYCVEKYDDVTQSWLKFGIGYKDCMKMAKFYEELKSQNHKLKVRKIQKKNNEIYCRLLESVQNDINKIRKENNKEMKRAVNNIIDIKLRLENENNM